MDLNNHMVVSFPTKMENDEFFDRKNLHKVFGYLIIISSILGLIPNVIFVKMVIYNKKNLIALPSFKLMSLLSLINVIALMAICISGFFTLYQSVGNEIFGHIVTAIGLPCYPAYCVTSAILSLHCLLQFISTEKNSIWFSKANLKKWVFLILFVYIAFAICFALPSTEVGFDIRYWFWSYNKNESSTWILMVAQEVCEDVAIIVSGIIYVIFLVSLIRMRRMIKTQHKSYIKEIRAFIQTLTITIYSLIFNIMWYRSDWFFPQTPATKASINFLWLINHTINPIIYLIVNKTIKSQYTPPKHLFRIIKFRKHATNSGDVQL